MTRITLMSAAAALAFTPAAMAQYEDPDNAYMNESETRQDRVQRGEDFYDDDNVDTSGTMGSGLTNRDTLESEYEDARDDDDMDRRDAREQQIREDGTNMRQEHDADYRTDRDEMETQGSYLGEEDVIYRDDPHDITERPDRGRRGSYGVHPVDAEPTYEELRERDDMQRQRGEQYGDRMNGQQYRDDETDATLRPISAHFDQATRVEQLFHAIDMDGNGMISQGEWAEWQSDSGWAARFDEFNLDNDNSLNWTEYQRAVDQMYPAAG